MHDKVYDPLSRLYNVDKLKPLRNPKTNIQGSQVFRAHATIYRS